MKIKNRRKSYLDQKGSLMIELCAVCILLLSFFLFMGEMVLYIRDVIHVQQAAREGAREASLLSSSPRFNNPCGIGREKALDCMEQYFGDTFTGNVNLVDTGGSYVCDVEYQHQVFCLPAACKLVHGTAVYPSFKD